MAPASTAQGLSFVKVLPPRAAGCAAAPTVTTVGRPACSTVACARVSSRCSLTSWSLQPARETTQAGVSAGQPAAHSRRPVHQLAAGHVEDLAVGAARGAQFAVLRHGGAEGHAAAPAAARQRPPGRGSGGQRGRDAGHHLAVDAVLGQCLQFFFQPAEQARVAALQPYHPGMLLRLPHQQCIDGGLPRGVGEAALAHVDPLRTGGQFAQGRVGEGVEQHHVGTGQQARAAQRDEVGAPGSTMKKTVPISAPR